MWISIHVEISGNEVVDMAAKEAVNSEQLTSVCETHTFFILGKEIVINIMGIFNKLNTL